MPGPSAAVLDSTLPRPEGEDEQRRRPEGPDTPVDPDELASIGSWTAMMTSWCGVTGETPKCYATSAQGPMVLDSRPSAAADSLDGMAAEASGNVRTAKGGTDWERLSCVTLQSDRRAISASSVRRSHTGSMLADIVPAFCTVDVGLVNSGSIRYDKVIQATVGTRVGLLP
ncbi:2-3-cyclic-nucleotide 2-phosphodiesterase [Apiospora saccharicola]